MLDIPVDSGFVLADAPFGGMVLRGDLEAALRGIAAYFIRLNDISGQLGTQFPFPAFDAVCCELGQRSAFELFAHPPAPIDVAHDVVLVTEARVQGGHAEIVRDIASWSTRPVLVVVTNLLDHKQPLLPQIVSHPKVLGIVALTGSWLERLRDAQALLCRAQVHRVHVLCHAHDTVAIAASGHCGKPTLFFHHCDHGPCLGCYLPDAFHIDLHNLGLERCRRDLGVASRYVCLTSREGMTRADGSFATPRFKSATCGGEHKLTRLRYPIGYTDVLVHLLRARNGVHFHIGHLSDGFLAALRERLHRAGVPDDSFVHVGHIFGFREIAAALEIDLYLPTLPQAGGKALIDAMAAGVPILAHDNAIDRLWGSGDLIYPSARSWSTLEDLDIELARFDAEHWHAQARASLAHYRSHHSNDLFARQLAADGALSPPPPLRPYRPDLSLRIGLLGLHDALS